jgi:SAM-dependent methyltransferase
MDTTMIFEYFEKQAKTGEWDSLYNPNNTISYPFIIRLHKAIQYLNDAKDKTVCDLGCGTGILIPFVIERGGDYIGVDNSPEMIKTAQEKYSSYNKSNKIFLVCSDFQNLKIEKKCDIFIGLGFIEYFNDPEKTITMIYDYLPTGGQLILSFPNFKSLDYLTLQLFSPFRYIVRLLFNKGTPQPPRKLWTLKKAEKMFHDAGFNNLEHINYNVNILFYPFSRFFPGLCYALAKKIEYSGLSKINFFSTGFIVSAKK